MNRWQKIARFNVAVIVTSLTLCVFTTLLLAQKVGFPRAGAGFSLLGICGLLALGPTIYRKRPRGVIDSDERDDAIHRKSALGGFVVTYLFFGVVCMSTWAIVGIEGSISANILPLIFMAGYIVAELTRSVIQLALYGREVAGEMEEVTI